MNRRGKQKNLTVYISVMLIVLIIVMITGYETTITLAAQDITPITKNNNLENTNQNTESENIFINTALHKSNNIKNLEVENKILLNMLKAIIDE